MNPDEVVGKIISMLDAQIARCERCEDGIRKTRQGLAVLADEMAMQMPGSGKTAYMRAALSEIAGRSHHD
jgi:hypothetical protein